MKRAARIVAAAFAICAGGAAAAETACDAALSFAYFDQEDAISDFFGIRDGCGFEDAVAEFGQPASHHFARWAPDAFFLAHIDAIGPLDAVDEAGNTVLHAAATGTSESNILFLVWLGFDLDTPNAAGQTPRDIILASSIFTRLEYGLVRNASLRDLLSMETETLIRQGGRPTGQDCDPLCNMTMGAATPEAVLLALLQGANPAQVSPTGISPLHFSAFNGNKGALVALVRAGLDVNLPSVGKDMTPLHAAVEGGHEDIVHLLLDLGADPTRADGNGILPRGYASASFLRTDAFERLEAARETWEPAAVEPVEDLSAVTAGHWQAGPVREVYPLSFDGSPGSPSFILDRSILETCRGVFIAEDRFSVEGGPVVAELDFRMIEAVNVDRSSGEYSTIDMEGPSGTVTWRVLKPGTDLTNLPGSLEEITTEDKAHQMLVLRVKTEVLDALEAETRAKASDCS